MPKRTEQIPTCQNQQEQEYIDTTHSQFPIQFYAYVFQQKADYQSGNVAANTNPNPKTKLLSRFKRIASHPYRLLFIGISGQGEEKYWNKEKQQ